jgi:hypothetical protein
VSIGVQWFEPMDKPTMQPVHTSGCAVQQTDHHTLVGIQGEPKNLIPWDKLAEFFEKNLK